MIVAATALLTATGLTAGNSIASADSGSATQAAAHNPTGTFALAVSGHRVHFVGTAVDPDGATPRVGYYLNGVLREVWLTSKYDRVWALPYGSWAIKVVAFNAGPGTSNTVLGDRHVAFVNPATRNPHGGATIAPGGQSLHVRGTAYDPDMPYRSVRVRVFDNNRLAAVTATWGAHAHVFQAAARLTPGRHLIKVVAYNILTGTGNPVIASKWVTAAAPAWQASYSGNQRIAASMLAAYGWGQNQMAPLIMLWNHESGWSASANNSSSGAYGIPQALPGGKMATSGADWRTNPATQIRWGLSYIKGRFGSPAGAWAHEVAYNWY